MQEIPLNLFKGHCAGIQRWSLSRVPIECIRISFWKWGSAQFDCGGL